MAIEDKDTTDLSVAPIVGPDDPRRFTDSGIEIQPLYTEADLPEDLDLGEPGEFPFTRGIHREMYRKRRWTMRQYAGYASANESNERYKYLLKNGSTGLSMAFDLPTQLGLDSDDPRCLGEVGRTGVAIDTIEDMRMAFDGIPLDEVSTSMTINAPASVLLLLYELVAEEQGVPSEKLAGTVQNDILKEYIARGNFIYPPEPSMRLATDLFAYCTGEHPEVEHGLDLGLPLPREGLLGGPGGRVHAGQRHGLRAGGARRRASTVDDFAPRLAFFFNGHNNVFQEVAKFRAARNMWAHAMRDRFGAEDPKSQTIRFHTQTGGVTLTAQQPVNNIVRVALQGFAAVCGGTQSLHTNGYDEALALPSERAAKIALRTQQILAHESGAADTVDPFAGSYYVEALTADIERRAWALIEKIDEMGGSVEAIAFIKSEIEESAFGYHERYRTGQDIVVGVNKYEEDDIEVEDILPRRPRDRARPARAPEGVQGRAATRSSPSKRLEELRKAAPRAPTTCSRTSSRRSRTTARSARSAARCASSSASTSRSTSAIRSAVPRCSALLARGAGGGRADARRARRRRRAGALHRYYSASTNTHWVTPTPVTGDFAYEQTLGFLRPRPEPGGRRSTAAARAAPTTSSRSTPAARARPARRLRLGRVRAAVDEPSVPLYRCRAAGHRPLRLPTTRAARATPARAGSGYLRAPDARPARYNNGSTTWVTSGMPSAGFALEAGIGFLLQEPGGNRSALYECAVGRRPFLSLDAGLRGPAAEQGLSGYVYARRRRTRTTARVPLHGRREHFASVDPGCEGQRGEGLLGYARRTQELLKRAYSPSTNTHWVTAGAVPPGWFQEFVARLRATSARAATAQALVRLPARAPPTSSCRSTRGCEGRTQLGREGWLYTDAAGRRRDRAAVPLPAPRHRPLRLLDAGLRGPDARVAARPPAHGRSPEPPPEPLRLTCAPSARQGDRVAARAEACAASASAGATTISRPRPQRRRHAGRRGARS